MDTDSRAVPGYVRVRENHHQWGGLGSVNDRKGRSGGGGAAGTAGLSSGSEGCPAALV